MGKATPSIFEGLGRLLRTPKMLSASLVRVTALGVGESEAATAPSRMG